MNYRYLIFLLAIAVTGCASMSSDECAQADWHAYGYEDGTNGQNMQYAARRARTCTKHGFEMDHTAYNSGRHEGLANFCTQTIAYDLGERGKKYRGVCKDHDESSFLAAYNRGYELYRFVNAVKYSQKQLTKASNRHSKLDGQIRKYTTGYRDKDLSMEEHNEKVFAIISERKWLAKEAIPYWTVENRYAKRELEGYRDKVAAGDSSLGKLRPRGFDGPRPYEGTNVGDSYEVMADLLGRSRSR